MSEAIFVITSALKDVCGKPPTERLFLDKYGKICLCLDEIVWTVRGIVFMFEHLKIPVVWRSHFLKYCGMKLVGGPYCAEKTFLFIKHYQSHEKSLFFLS